MAADSKDQESAKNQNVTLPQGLADGLNYLRESRLRANDSELDAWQFAVELKTLLNLGLTLTDCRWLVCNGLIKHAREISIPGGVRREFQESRNLKFWSSTCFVLSDTGMDLFSQTFDNGVRADSSRGPKQIPVWSAGRHELLFRGIVVKRFKLPAANQEAVLQAFEEERWPPRIDDPLRPKSGQDPKRRLHDTINSLNRRQKQPLLRFYGDGTGRGVCWKAQPLPPHDQ